MDKSDGHITMDGRGVRPSTPRPLPTFVQPGKVVGHDARGAGLRPTTPKPPPSKPSAGK